jgi:hypothetical protein
VSAVEVLGSAPPRGHVEAHTAYRAAHAQRDDLTTSATSSSARPPATANLLAGTRQAEAREAFSKPSLRFRSPSCLTALPRR